MVREMAHFSGGLRWTIHAPGIASEVVVGDSVNVSGACQTVEAVTDGRAFSGTSIRETLDATNFDSWTVGHRVNLELALRASDRFGGHFVSGHVDCTGEVREVRRGADGHWVDIAFAPRYDRWVIAKGSVAIDGVSLTVMQKRPGLLTVSFIPETVSKTTLSDLRRGGLVNIEFDMLVKAVVLDLADSHVTEGLLSQSGW
jgi:riboflavin synthase